METTMDVTGGEPPLTLCALPDALLLHILTYLPRAELGAAGRVAKRLQTLATDDEVWRSECVSSFGLAVREDEHGQECHTFYEAARQWSRFARETIGVASTKKLPTLASDWRMAQEAWGRVARWAGKELPEAWASLGPPATPAEWATLLRRLKLEATPETSAALLALRLLSAVHDGQRIASDAAFILDAANFDDADADELIEALSRASGRAVGGRSRSGVQKWYASPAKHDDTIGLGGGFSAYEELACVRVLPVLLIEAYTTLVREKCSFPEHVLIVGASQNMSRVLAYDLETGELFLGPAGQSGPLSGRTRKRMGKLAMLPVCPLGHASRGRDVLLWMNELGCRLEGGMYLATPLLPPHESTRGLCLFPQNGPQFVSQVRSANRRSAALHRRSAPHEWSPHEQARTCEQVRTCEQARTWPFCSHEQARTWPWCSQ
jgi:hypothetical protein